MPIEIHNCSGKDLGKEFIYRCFVKPAMKRVPKNIRLPTALNLLGHFNSLKPLEKHGVAHKNDN